MHASLGYFSIKHFFQNFKSKLKTRWSCKYTPAELLNRPSKDEIIQDRAKSLVIRQGTYYDRQQ